MSAYLVNRETIDLLVRGAITYGLPSWDFRWYYQQAWRTLHTAEDRDALWKTPAELGQCLWDANWKSIQTRYPDCEDPATWISEPLVYTEPKATGPLLISSEFTPTHVAPNPLHVLKVSACLDYQSCEYEGWRDSEARAILDALREGAIHALPGYSDAPWGVEPTRGQEVSP